MLHEVQPEAGTLQLYTEEVIGLMSAYRLTLNESDSRRQPFVRGSPVHKDIPPDRCTAAISLQSMN